MARGTPSAFFLVPQNPLGKHFSATNPSQSRDASPFALSGTHTTMASYATIPAEAETEKPLMNRDVRVNLKTVIGGAAIASFVLGTHRPAATFADES